MLLALVSLLGVFGQGEQTARTLNNWVEAYAPADLARLLRDTLTGLANHAGRVGCWYRDWQAPCGLRQAMSGRFPTR
ncbi:hypothetical protein [Tessaracoccus coleopterorum]|uniref:hypothetical protein n=1 Tax=Tessaracoccus coleopterorum TaxID=2714950 RepID=UPI0018D4B725